jgi:hypothetical protein
MNVTFDPSLYVTLIAAITTADVIVIPVVKKLLAVFDVREAVPDGQFN